MLYLPDDPSVFMPIIGPSSAFFVGLITAVLTSLVLAVIGYLVWSAWPIKD